MYETADSLLAANGYVHYEISNWALSEPAQCRHNLIYWRNEPYLGLGAGAHSWMSGCRRANVASPGEYVTRMSARQDLVDFEETIGPDLEIGETMMLGLRLLQEGVEYARFHRRFGVDLRWRFADEIDELEQLDLVVCDTVRIRLSSVVGSSATRSLCASCLIDAGTAETTHGESMTRTYDPLAAVQAAGPPGTISFVYGLPDRPPSRPRSSGKLRTRCSACERRLPCSMAPSRDTVP